MISTASKCRAAEAANSIINTAPIEKLRTTRQGAPSVPHKSRGRQPRLGETRCTHHGRQPGRLPSLEILEDMAGMRRLDYHVSRDLGRRANHQVAVHLSTSPVRVVQR